MIENYSFNENYKRFEPLETECTYCGESHMTTMNDCYFIPLFIEGNRTNIVVYRSVKYSKILIGIPRCSSCKKIHEDSRSKAIWVSLGLVVTILVFIIYFFMSLNVVVIVLGVFAMIFGGIFGSAKLTERYTANQGIYTLQDGAETNEVIRDLVIAGWSFTQPSA